MHILVLVQSGTVGSCKAEFRISFLNIEYKRHQSYEDNDTLHISLHSTTSKILFNRSHNVVSTPRRLLSGGKRPNIASTSCQTTAAMPSTDYRDCCVYEARTAKKALLGSSPAAVHCGHSCLCPFFFHVFLSFTLSLYTWPHTPTTSLSYRSLAFVLPSV